MNAQIFKYDLTAESRMSEKEFRHDYYDHLYRKGHRNLDQPLTSPYYPLYRKMVELMRKEGLHSVLEVGCGGGVMAEMLIANGVSYQGFDFSPAAIEKAQSRNPGERFSIGDATDPASYQLTYDGIVCCEVLEHIDGDLTAIEHWKKGSIVICSVPNFDYESHVRYFRSEDEVVRRYGQLLDIWQIERVATSASANLTWAEYLKRIRWARNEPTRLLGILGINRFEWYGGWFIFVGRRR